MNNNISVHKNRLKLPKLGFVKFAKSKELKGRIVNATIRQNASGTFFVSILCEEAIRKLPQTNKAIGMDLGITNFAFF